MMGRLFYWGSVLSLISIALVTVIHTALAVSSVYTPVPWGDIASEHHWIHKSGVQFIELFRPHNEHIIFIPRLFFLVDFFLFSASNKFLLITSFLLMLSAVAILSDVARRWFFGNNIDALMYACVLTVSYVNAMQLFNLTLGLMIQHWLEICFCLLFAAIFVQLFDQNRKNNELLLLFVLSGVGFCAVFSSGSGVFCLLAAIVVSTGFRMQWMKIIYFCLLTVILVGLYLHFNSRATSPQFLVVFSQPLNAVKCFFAFLGGPGLRYHVWPADSQFWAFNGWSAILRGFIVATLGTSLCILEWLNPLRRNKFSIFHVFIIVMVLLIAMVFVPSRIKIDVFEGVNSKYTNTIMIFWIATFSLLLKQLSDYKTFSKQTKQVGWIFTVTLALMLVIPAHFREIKVWKQWTNHLWESESALIAGVYNETLMRTLDWRPEAYFNILNEDLRRKRWAVYSRYQFEFGDKLEDYYKVIGNYPCIGNIDVSQQQVDLYGTKAMKLKGWAWDDYAKKSFHDILITNDVGRIVGVAHTTQQRNDVAEYFKSPARKDTGWTGFARNEGGLINLNAYGIVPGTLQVCLVGRI